MGIITRHNLFRAKKKRVRLEYFCSACKKDLLPIDKPSSGWQRDEGKLSGLSGPRLFFLPSLLFVAAIE
jgi:hypothetical protein